MDTHPNKHHKRRHLVSKFWVPLMLAQVIFIIFIVSLFPTGWHDVLYSISYTLLFFMAVMTIGKNRRQLLVVVFLGIVLVWISTFFHLSTLIGISKLFNFLFFLFMTGYYISEIAKAKEVNESVIFHAVNGYLLLGLIFSILVGLLMIYNPGMYNFPASPDAGSPKHFSEYLYFGFVTMTTLGYGDVVPLLPISRSLTTFISVSGQLYLAIIVAMLVGKYASQK